MSACALYAKNCHIFFLKEAITMAQSSTSPTSATDSAVSRSDAWDRAIEQQRVALAAYVAGDPGPFWATYSNADDATIFGGFGGWAKGWQDIEQRTSWSSSQYHDGTGEPRILSSGHSGDIGYTIHLEHISVHTGPSATLVDKTYRVTHIFRWEDEQWKLIHRHADPLIETQAPN